MNLKPISHSGYCNSIVHLTVDITFRLQHTNIETKESPEQNINQVNNKNRNFCTL